ncbi:MAG TPA: oligosaccharide flippase family protein [Prochlorococcus sp.]|nr:oligosaccharide flippase family protein [Prochlorococcus sp.]
MSINLSGKKISMFFAEGIFSGYLGLAVAALYARSLLTEDYGKINAAIGVVFIFAVICQWGMPNLAVKIFKATGESTWEDEARGIRYFAPRVIIIFSFTIALLLVLWHALFPSPSSLLLKEFIFIAALLPFVCLSNFYSSSSLAHGGGLMVNTIMGWGGKVFNLAVLAAVLIFFKSRIAIFIVISTYAIVVFAQLFCIFILTKSVEPTRLKLGNRKVFSKKWLKQGMPFALTSFGSAFFFSSGVVVMGLVLGDNKGAAMLAAASGIAGLVLTTSRNVMSLFYPIIVEATERRNAQDIFAILRQWFRFLALFSAPFFTVKILFAKYLLSFYGNDYSIAYWATIILLCGFLVYVFLNPFSYVYQFSGYEKSYTYITYIFAGFTVPAMVFAGREWSFLGVAFVIVFALLGRALLTSFLALRQIRRWA